MPTYLRLACCEANTLAYPPNAKPCMVPQTTVALNLLISHAMPCHFCQIGMWPQLTRGQERQVTLHALCVIHGT